MIYLKPGDRVGAFAEVKDGECKFIGWGEYLGDFELDNPKCVAAKLKLDDGTELHGFECIWGSEARVKREIGNRKLVPITVLEAGQLLLKKELAAGKGTGPLFNLRLLVASQFTQIATAVHKYVDDKIGKDIIPIEEIVLPSMAISMAGALTAFSNAKKLTKQVEELSAEQKGSSEEVFKYIKDKLEIDRSEMLQFRDIIRDIQAVCQKWMPGRKFDFLPQELIDVMEKGLDEKPPA